MEILRSFLTLLAGFATMGLLIALMGSILGRAVPAWVGVVARPGPGYVSATLAYSFVSAAAGGYVTAWMGTRNPLRTVLTLAIAVLALGALSALQARGRQPAWYQIALLVITSLGVMAGGLLRLQLAGLL